MHLESRCYSSSAINKQTNSDEEGIEHPAATASTSINRTWVRPQKKDKAASGAGIFSFLQKFRVVHGKNEANAVADSSFSLGSPQSSRYSLASVGVGAGRRWESIESVISSATATSFAFIPPHQLRQFNYPRPPPRTGALEREQRTRREKYRLAADENRPSAAVDSKDIANVKRLNRNSTGNIDNFWIPNNVPSCATSASVSPPNKGTSIIPNPNKRKLCHRPGKRKAPPPPGTSARNPLDRDNVNSIESKIINGSRHRVVEGITVKYEDDVDDDEDYENYEKTDINISAKKTAITYRKKKKRQAPLPPTKMNDEKPCSDSGTKTQQKIIDPIQSDPFDDDEPIMYSNDSLKLEKGILKANKHSVEISNKNDTDKLAPPTSPQVVAVSPKPWYKRSCVKVNTHNNLVGFREKRNSCRKGEMDRWMLESGIARFRRTDDDIFKRHSHISVLANISELDRQASEILEKQRKQQREAINSVEAKFYSDFMENDKTALKERFLFNESATSNTKKNKDLISILNNLTSVTKTTVHSAFVSKTASREVEDNANNAIPSGSSASSINKMVQRSRQPASSNLSINKNKKTSKIGEIFDKSHSRDVRKKDDKKTLNKSYSSFDTANDKGTSFNKSTFGTSTDALIPIKTSFESDNVDKNNEIAKQQIPRPVQKPFSSWSCPQCNSENPSWKFICEKCKKWRPYSVNSRTTDQRYFVNIEKVDLKKSDNAATDKQQEQRSPLQLMHLNVNNTVASQQNHSNDDTKKVNNSKSSESNNQRDFNRREFYSSIAATVDNIFETGNPDTSSPVTSSTMRNNLNGTQQTKSQVNQTLQYYNDQDRKMLCDILKELRHSLSSSRRNRMAIDTDMANEEKIINKVDSVILEPPTKSNERITTVDTSLNDDSKSTKNCNDASSTTLTQHNNSAELELNSNTSGSELLQNLKPEENDHIGKDETIQNERKLNESKVMVENKNVPVLAINRLLKKLQTAIANGQHHEAANIARELARLKVNCHMTRRGNFNNAGPSNSKIENPSLSTSGSLDTFVISVYIKKHNHCRGPIPLQIHNTTTLEQLKMKLTNEFKIPSESQQWRSEKSILNDETAILYDIGINKPGIPLYIHLTNNEEIADGTTSKNDASSSSLEKMITTPIIKNIHPEPQNKEYELRTYTQLQEFDLQTPKNKDANLEHKDDTDANEIYNDKNKADEQTIPTKVDLENERLTPPTQTLNKINNHITETASLTNAGWQCTLCTLINESHLKFCAACGEQCANADTNENNTHDTKTSASTSQPNYHYAPWRITKKDQNVNNDNQETKNKDAKKLYYQELIDLEKSDLITNKERFECSVCLMECEENEGVVLRDCLHTFCKDCLQQTVQFSTEAQVKCPFGNASYSCDSVLQEREIKTLVDADTYEKHLARSLSEAQNKIKNAFHCKTPNCTGWCIYEDNVNEFRCPVCRKTNCLTCQVIHGGLNCKQYQEMTRKESENNADTSKTRNMLEEMVEKGEAMVCPTCDIILMKKWGCDWLRCSMCKTEICWVTRGPRWGPAGKGDTSAGCRCGVNGVKCHPRCNYCH